MKRWPLLIVLALLLMGQGTGGVGVFVRSDCTTITGPVTGQSWCLDATAQVPKVWNGSAWVQSPTLSATIAAGTSRLTYVSATSIQLGLGVVPLKVSGTWTMRAVTTVVTCNNTGLGASTTYYVYVYDAPGTTCKISATGHSTDSSFGVETLTGDTTRTLVGIVRTNAASQFEQDNALLGVRSFFNRAAVIGYYTAAVDVSTASSTLSAYGHSIPFVAWTDDIVSLSISGYAFTAAAANSAIYAVLDPGLDGAAVGGGGGMSVNGGDLQASGRIPIATGTSATVAEGYHTPDPLIASGDNVTTWHFVLTHSVAIR